MADMKEAIRRMLYQYSVEGADKVMATQEAIAASTTKTDKASLSLEKTFGSLERRYIDTVRAQQDFQRVQERVNAAVAQNPALQERANAVLAAATQRYGQATAAQNAFAVATSGVSAQLVALSAGAGPVGTFLSALGPWGMAASVGIGAVAAVFDRLNEGAKRVGDKSIEMKKFSDVTGLSVTEIKGLTRAGADLGLNTDDITSSIERFSIGLNEARRGSGALFDQVVKINPVLAEQLAQAKGTAQGFDILAQAIKQATDAAQRNALARAAFGRGGIETGLLAAATVDQGGVAAMGDKIAKNTGLTKEWVTETARLRQENIELEKATTAAMDAAFALPVLQRQNEYLRTLKEIADLMVKGGGFKAPGADDYGAPFASYLSPPVAPLSQRGSSEGAMQAQQEAAAQREIAEAIEKANKAREYAVSVDKMLLTIATDAAEAEKRKAAIFARNAELYPKVSATTAQTLAQQKDQLSVASAIGGEARRNAQYYATINTLMAQGKSLVDATAIAEGQRAQALAQIASAHEVTMVSLQGQLGVAQAITGAEQASAQAAATYNNLRMQGLTIQQASAQAELQFATAIAGVNSEAERTLKTLKNENELINASSDAERDRIKSRQTYNELLEKGVSASKAQQVASQQLANADDQRSQAYEKMTDQQRDQADLAEMSDYNRSVELTQRARIVELANEEADATERSKEAARQRRIETEIYLHEIPLMGMAMSLFNPPQMGKDVWQKGGQLTQFNPAGYTSSIQTPAQGLALGRYGEGGFDPNTGRPNAQGLEFQFNQMLASSGLQGATSGFGLTPSPGLLNVDASNLTQAMAPQGALDTSKLSLVTRAIELMPESDKGAAYQKLLGELQGMPKSLEVMEAMQSLTDKIEQLAQSTDQLNSTNQTMTDVLSPFYTSDPRRTHLGFRAFAGGGIMTEYGALPLRQYQGGGMATSPQVAVFGEGSTPEAYVPVPSGRIPVELKGANSNRRPVNVTINVMGNADQNTVAALKSTAFQQAQAMRRVMR